MYNKYCSISFSFHTFTFNSNPTKVVLVASIRRVPSINVNPANTCKPQNFPSQALNKAPPMGEPTNDAIPIIAKLAPFLTPIFDMSVVISATSVGMMETYAPELKP